MTASEILNGGNLTASDIIGAADQTGHVFHGNQWVKTGGLEWQGADTKWQPGGSYPEDAKLKAFAEKVHQDTHQRYVDETPNPDVHRHYVSVKHGSKFDKVDVGGSGAFMVEKGTGQIYGVKGYGVVHPGKRYGTLDTIQEYNWGNHYFPVHKDAPKPRVGTPVKPIASHGTSHRSDYFQEHHADGSISLAASQQLTAADILRAGAPVGNRNAAGEHSGYHANAFTTENLSIPAEGHKIEGIGTIHRFSVWKTDHRGKPQVDDSGPNLEELRRKHNVDPKRHGSFGKESNEAAKASSASHSDAIQARAASDVIYAGATANFTVTASSQWELGKPVEFMYMPGGVHTICAHFRGQAIKLTVSVDPSDAAKVLNGSLEQLRASYKHPPFGCIEHEEKDASVWAKQFTAKGDGVYLAADPSELGVRHVNGLVHRSWSPSFLTDADYSKATLTDGTYEFPDGVRGSESNPAKITGCAFCLGTLTNKPAFREMSPVKAREATVKAVGTSEGIRKAWLTRRGEVSYSSEAAHRASDTAFDSVDPEDHDLAASEHMDAFKAHSAHAGHGGATKQEANYHQLIAAHHFQAAENHKGMADALRKSPVNASDYSTVDTVKAESTGPQPFNASAMLDVARALRVAHWNGDTATNEHEALGELYDAWEDGLDELVEATCGKRGCKVSEPAQGNTALAEQALAALSGVKDTLTAEDDDLLNIVADMENAVNKGRYLLKAKESDMTASEVLKASGTSEGVRKEWETRRGGLQTQAAMASAAAVHHTSSTESGYAPKGEKHAHDIGEYLHRQAAELHTQAEKDNPGKGHSYQAQFHTKEADKHAKNFHKLSASDASHSPSLVRALTAADILNHLAPDGADGKPAVK